MSRVVTFRLSDDRLAAIDRVVEAGAAESRSALVVAAIDAWLRESERRAVDDAYADAYARAPSTPEEQRVAEETGRLSVAEEPW